MKVDLTEKSSVTDADYLKSMNVVLAGYAVIHYIEQLREYLISKSRSLAYVAIPTLYLGNVGLSRILYEKGNITKYQRQAIPLGGKIPFYRYILPFVYLMHLWLFVFYTLSFRKVFDVYVGVSYQSALAGVALKKLRRAKRLVYYSFDYFAISQSMDFFTRLTYRFFQGLDEYCAKHCDVVWNLSREIQLARGQHGEVRAPNLLVPHPVTVSKLVGGSAPKPQIAFIGSLRRSQGVDLIIEAFPRIVKSIPSAKLLIIGSGPEENSLKNKAKILGIDDRIIFYGFVSSDKVVEEILTSSAFGVAPYDPREAEFIRFADPGKIKTYLSCGLPVLVTSGFSFADYLSTNRAGFAVNYDKDAFAEAAILLLTDKQKLAELRRNVLHIAAGLDTKTVFDTAFNASMDYLVEKS